LAPAAQRPRQHHLITDSRDFVRSVCGSEILESRICGSEIWNLESADPKSGISNLRIRNLESRTCGSEIWNLEPADPESGISNLKSEQSAQKIWNAYE